MLVSLQMFLRLQSDEDSAKAQQAGNACSKSPIVNVSTFQMPNTKPEHEAKSVAQGDQQVEERIVREIAELNAELRQRRLQERSRCFATSLTKNIITASAGQPPPKLDDAETPHPLSKKKQKKANKKLHDAARKQKQRVENDADCTRQFLKEASLGLQDKILEDKPAQEIPAEEEKTKPGKAKLRKPEVSAKGSPAAEDLALHLWQAKLKHGILLHD